jgi:hypothetical protein
MVREGAHTRENLGKIVEWKSDRRKALIAENSDDEIREALALALTAKEPRSALAVLIGLSGVALPMEYQRSVSRTRAHTTIAGTQQSKTARHRSSRARFRLLDHR